MYTEVNMKDRSKTQQLLKIIFSGTLILVFLISLVFTLTAIKKPVTIKEKEASEDIAGVNLYTSPTNISAVRGEPLTVDFDIDTQSDGISGADLAINYDKRFLVVNSIVPRDFFPKVLKRSDDNNGRISVVLAGNKGEVKQGRGTLVSVTFTALMSGATSIDYDQFSQVASSDKLVNVLTHSSGTTVNIIDPPSVKSSSDDSPKSEIVIYASGTRASGRYPTMEIVIDDQIVSVLYDIGEIEKKYTYTHPTKVQPSQVKLRFTNDLYDRSTGEDRNLRINKIQIDGVDYEAEGQSTYTVGSWNRNSCGEGYKTSEWLYCNGEFRF